METIKKNVTLERAGSLHKYIPKNERMFISHLKISGPLNFDDFNVLDDMCTSEGTFDEDDNYIIDLDNSPALIVLDLGDSILDDPFLPEFTYHSRLETFIAPKNLESISDIFIDSSFLKTVVLPEGVKELGLCAFASCKSLENINFPDTLTTIKHRCFYNCTGLRKIELPASLEYIDFRAFDECENLKEMFIYAVKPPIIMNPCAKCLKFLRDAKQLTLYVPKESLELYKQAERWSDIKKIQAINN
ncbi:MAG: leucine-rich repeat domain-containing protein [Bacteroidales bacterium]|nr:leucine-rich repeat domain-containing protein [Bacteroidales bacterium]